MSYAKENAHFFSKDKAEGRKKKLPKRWDNYMPYRFEVFNAIKALLLQSDRLLTRKEIIAALPDTEVRDINATLVWSVANNEFSQDRFFDPPRYGVSEYIPTMNEAKERSEGLADKAGRGNKLPKTAIQRIVKELLTMPETVNKRSISAAIRQLLMDSQRHLRKDIEAKLEKLGYTSVQANSNISAGIGKYIDCDPDKTYIWLNDKGRRQLIKEEGGRNEAITPAVKREQNWAEAITLATPEARMEQAEEAAHRADLFPQLQESVAQADDLIKGLADLGDVPERIQQSYLAKRKLGIDHESAKSAALRGATLAEVTPVETYNPETHAPSGRPLADIEAEVGKPREQPQERPPGDAWGAGVPEKREAATPAQPVEHTSIAEEAEEFIGVPPQPETVAAREERQAHKESVRAKADQALIQAADKLAAERLDRIDNMLRDATHLLERIEVIKPHGGERELPDNAQAYLSWDDKLVIAPSDNEVLYFSNEQTLKLAMMLSKLLK